MKTQTMVISTSSSPGDGNAGQAGQNSNSTAMFRDQVNTLTAWFRNWSECEQTVTLCALLKLMSPAQSSFLAQVIQQSLSEYPDIEKQQEQANNPMFIQGLLNETKQEAVNQLLAHLPLLLPGNHEAKAAYLRLIPHILAHSAQNRVHMEESRQLLSFCLIHPAVTAEERMLFHPWLGQLGEHGGNQYSYQSNEGMMTNDVPPTAIVWSDNSPLLHHAGEPSCRDSGIGLVNPDSGNLQLPLQANIHTSSGGTTNGHSPSNGDHAGLKCTPSGAPNMATSIQQGHRKLSRSSAITPPVTPTMTPGGANTLPINSLPGTSNVSEWLNAHHDMMVRSHSFGGVDSRDAGLSAGFAGSDSNAYLLSGQYQLLSQSQKQQLLHYQQQQLQQQQQMSGREHEQLSPKSSSSSSSSDGLEQGGPLQTNQNQSQEASVQGQPQAKNTFIEEGSGMKDVPAWLKSLRLHKYSYLFQQMSYEDMMTLSEKWLESQMVTKGARHKIVLSINKLHDRPNMLRAMEKEVSETANLKQPLIEIKNMLTTPLKAFDLLMWDGKIQPGGDKVDTNDNNTRSATPPTGQSPQSTTSESDSLPDSDLPGLITRVLTKICAQILVCVRPEDDSLTIFLQLLDKCVQHEAFTQKQKNLMLSWKDQIRKTWHPHSRVAIGKQNRLAYGNTYPIASMAGGKRAVRGVTMKTPSGPATPAGWTFRAPPPQLTNLPPAQLAALAANIPLVRNNGPQQFMHRPQLLELKPQVQRTHSAPIKASQYHLSTAQRPYSEIPVSEPEINTQLESLCLSMTEHALGGTDALDKTNNF